MIHCRGSTQYSNFILLLCEAALFLLSCYYFCLILQCFSSASLSEPHPSIRIKSNEIKTKSNQTEQYWIILHCLSFLVCLSSYLRDPGVITLFLHHVVSCHVMSCCFISCHIPLSALVSVECKTGHDMMLGLESRHLWYKMSEKECQTIFLSESWSTEHGVKG